MDRLTTLMAETADLLGQPARVGIVEVLSDGPATAREIAARLDLSPGVVADELLVLVVATIVRADADERFALTDPDVASACRTIRSVLRGRLASLETLADLTLEGRAHL